MKKAIVLMAALSILGVISVSAQTYVWIEGENTGKTNLEQAPWPKGNNPKLLSGGDAFSCAVKGAVTPSKPFISYYITIPENGRYVFWAREFYKGSGSFWKYRLIECNKTADGKFKPKVKPTEDMFISANEPGAKLDLTALGKDRALMWCKYGGIVLKKGHYILNIKFTTAAGNKPLGSGDLLQVFDCFILSKAKFIPRGKLKPGEKSAAAADNEDDF